MAMIKKKNALRKGQAHVEYLALKTVIEELAAAGHNLKSIHEKLKAEGRISMSYQALHENMTRAERKGRRAHSGTAGKQIQVPPQTHHAKPAVSSGVTLAELDAAMEEASAKRGGVRKKSGDENPADGRKDVIG